MKDNVFCGFFFYSCVLNSKTCDESLISHIYTDAGLCLSFNFDKETSLNSTQSGKSKLL